MDIIAYLLLVFVVGVIFYISNFSIKKDKI